jgi:hypothetical protein
MTQTARIPRATWRALVAGAVVGAASMPMPGVAVSATPANAIVTILEGPATLLDGVRRSVAAPGSPLAAGTIVETAATTRLLRIEWPDGAAINLGPDTRAMLSPPGFTRRDRSAPALYLLHGWAQYSGPPATDTLGLVARLFELAPFTGVVVTRVDRQGAWVFVQTGTVSLVERQVRPELRHDLSAGSAYTRNAAAPGTVVARASSSDLQLVPRAFRDTLPSRYAQAAGTAPAAEFLPAPTYADLQPWLMAEPAAQAGFTRRLRPLLSDRAFRRDLDAHLSDHAEWRPILHPPPPPNPPSALSGTYPTR